MLDNEMKEQLKSLFAPLENSIDLVYQMCSHEDQSELLTLLTEISNVSEKISLRADNRTTLTPQFHIEKNGRPTGISFRGIPGGHEFSSLVLAILHSDGKGKFPDPVLLHRIKNLKGPIDLTTYISLSCENCPDVVQALNQMALIHPNFKHQMVDGKYAQDEIKTLNIQGVPSVAFSNQLIHSGRIQFIDLLKKLEDFFGTIEVAGEGINLDLGSFDTVVIGGGPAGVSAAIYSVRKGLKTALITEKVGGQVQETKGIENLISVTYTEGPHLAAQLHQHLAAYPVQVLENRRVKNIANGTPKQISLESGEFLKTNSVIVATGAKWRELGIPGEKDYIGRGVAFCPHCDGPYYKNKKVAVIGGGNSGVEAAIDLAGIVKEVVLFEFQDQLKADHILVEKLKSLPNTSIVTSAKTTQILGDGQKVVALEYQDRKTNETKKVEFNGIFVQIGLIPNSQFIKDLVETNKFGEIVTDTKGRTSIKGIYAAGDVTNTPFKQIVIAMGEGAKAALAAFEDHTYEAK